VAHSTECTSRVLYIKCVDKWGKTALWSGGEVKRKGILQHSSGNESSNKSWQPTGSHGPSVRRPESRGRTPSREKERGIYITKQEHRNLLSRETRLRSYHAWLRPPRITAPVSVFSKRVGGKKKPDPMKPIAPPRGPQRKSLNNGSKKVEMNTNKFDFKTTHEKKTEIPIWNRQAGQGVSKKKGGERNAPVKQRGK